jgi:hypothetical protein
MLRLIAVVGFALSIATSAQGMTLRRFLSRTTWRRKLLSAAAPAGQESMVFAWHEPPSARRAEPSAGVCDGRLAFALRTSE